MGEFLSIPYLWISFFLALCSVFDFYSAKISNKIIICSFTITVLLLFVFFPLNVWINSLQSFFLMFVLGFLLFKFKILGGADIKILCIVSLFLTPLQIKDFLMFSFLWAAAYAFIFYLIAGQLYSVVFNTFTVYKKITVAHHKIPFTFGILLGWMSLFSMGILSWS